MTTAAHFRWHPDARLFDGENDVARHCDVGSGFVWLASTALDVLGAAIEDGRPFCLSDAPAPEGITLSEEMFLTQSGGSSGVPKRIRRSQMSWIRSFEVNAKLFNLTPNDRVAVLGSLSHSLALYGVLEALHLGADALVLAGASPQRQLRLLAGQGATVLYTTPTQLKLLMTRETPLPALRLILCGGGMLDDDTQRHAQALFPHACLYAFYGAAETSFITLAGPDTPRGSVGRGYPGVEIKILDPKGREASGIGKVCVRSPYLCDGYADGRALDRQDGWVSAGELGKLDAQGFLWLKGREDRMVTVGDVNVNPETVEALINTLPDVQICAVLPRPDRQRGHHLVAIVGMSDAPDLERLRDTCRQALGPALRPRQVLAHPDFPLLPSGKPDLVALTHWLEKQP